MDPIIISDYNAIVKNIHFVGIGGIGISGLAGIEQKFGNMISGSDMVLSGVTEALEKNGAKIFQGHAAKNIPHNTSLVIHSFAVSSDNPELQEARRRRIPVLSYPQALGRLTKKFFTIAVCGTHGKSTITSLIAKVLLENAFDPTVVIGTLLRELGGRNFRVGKSRLFVLEACEYRRAFLNYAPRVILLHTLDPDHLDYFRNFEDYLRAFEEFAEKLPPDGYFFANLDDEDVHKIVARLQKKKFPAHNIFTYSTRYPSSDFYLMGNKIVQKNARVGELSLKIPGAHNRSNALAAFSVCATFGITAHDILRSLNHYSGASRRFEMKGRLGKTVLIDDYAHHPAEIEATLQAAREKFGRAKICVVFQPHQYSRTKKLLKEFGGSFGQADMVIIPNIYEVRDSAKDIASISPEKFVAEIAKHHRHVIYGGGLEKTAEYVKKNAKKFDVVMTMGAGDVWKINYQLLQLPITNEFLA